MINKELNSVLKNIEQSNGLPNKNYIDNKQYDVEKRVLIFDQWAGVMVADEIPEPGDAKPLTFIDIPLLLLRNEKNEIKVSGVFPAIAATLSPDLTPIDFK